MARRKAGPSGGEKGLAARAEWILERLSEYSDGIHRLGDPAHVLDSALPKAVSSICREFNGAELFHESIILFPGADIRSTDRGFHVGEFAGEPIFVDRRGAVWRFDSDIEELLLEGTRFDRWLAGAVDAESFLYDREGEFLEGVFDEEGELSDASDAERAHRQLKRDPNAVAPKWRLARALVRTGESAKARAKLEEVVAEHEDFPWAWFDLARISEGLGEAAVASEEAEHAGLVRPGYDYNVFFMAHAARLAQVANQDERAAGLASEVLRLDPNLPRNHVEAAREQMQAGNPEAARELLMLAKVVAPRDLQVIDLLSQLQN